MSAAAPRADFKLILQAVNPAHLQGIIAELMEVFHIDRKMATEAVQNVPLVLVGGMSQQQAANLRSHLVRLGKLGAQLRLTSEPIGKLKALRWQALPPAVRRPATVFICPHCGERVAVQRWQPVPAAPPAPAAEPAPAPAPAAAEPVPAPPEEPPPAPEAEAAPAEPPALPAEEIPEAELVEAAPAEAEAIPEAAHAEAPELATLTEYLDSVLDGSGGKAPAEAAPAPAAEPLEALPVEEAAPGAAVPVPEPPAPEPPKPRPRPVQPAPAPPLQPRSQPRPAQAVPRPVAPQPAAPRPAAPQPAPPPEAEALASPRYDVSVAKVRGPKQDTLVQLLVERLGLSPEDAQRQVDRTIVMVCKGGSATEADDWRRTLEEIGLKPHIRKR